MEEKEKTATAHEDTTSDTPKKKQKTLSGDPVIWTTRVVFLLAALIFVWYIYSDRLTPYTSLGRITEIIVPITPRVSGYLIDVKVRLNSAVKTNELLFQIDTTQYALEVKKAEANLENVAQQLGAQSASVKAAASSVGVAKAQLDRAQRNYNRAQRIIKKNPGALSQSDIDRVETSLNQAQENLANAEANLLAAKKQLGVTGANNPQLRMAINGLNNAQLQMDWTRIYAPADGYIESFNLDVGYFCAAGKPIATLVTKEDLWIQANFKENNLSHMKPGDKVEFILDIAPGKIFTGTVRSIGFGVESDNRSNPGQLPRVKSKSSWLQDPQRFPVLIDLDKDEAVLLSRAGGQADVVVYTGRHPFLNTLAHFRIWVNSWLSYIR